MLVILGAVILDRNRSDDGTTTVGGAVSGPGTGQGEPSAGGGTVGPNAGSGLPDLCDLLPEDLAEDLAGVDLQPNDIARSLSCRYEPADGARYPKVILDSQASEHGLWNCSPQHLCGQIDEPYPALPGGELWWWDQHVRLEAGDAGFVGGAWVRWQIGGDRWELHYFVEIEAPGTDISSERDEVAAHAERIHQEVTANPDKWGVDE